MGADKNTELNISKLKVAENKIRTWIENNRRNVKLTLQLPIVIQDRIKTVLNRKTRRHFISINGIFHAISNHGIKGKKLSKESFPIRDEDFALIPYILISPDYITKGSVLNGRESIRFYKMVSCGKIVVVEKECINSQEDFETINVWGELSEGVNAPKDPNKNVRNVFLSTSDVAKIKKDAETAIFFNNNFKK